MAKWKQLGWAMVFLSGCVGPARVMPMRMSDTDPGKQPAAVDGAIASGYLAYHLASSILKSSPKNKQIFGECRIQVEMDSLIDAPCNQVEIALMDEKGKEIAVAQTNEGRFSFEVEKSKKYRLKVKTNKFQLSNDLIGPFESGNSVSVKLIPIKNL